MRPGVLLLFAGLTACADDTAQPQRSAVSAPAIAVTESIDWSESAGIFIGVETFRSATDAPSQVRYAADDAADLAWLFTQELPSLLRPDRTLLLLSGRPNKERSRAHLLTLQREGVAVVDDFDAGSIEAHIREHAAKVGNNGVLILSIATHGVTVDGAHVLLMPEATKSDPKGVVLDRMLQAIPPGRGNRVLLFADACRRPFSPAPARLFEELQFPGRYAIFAASGPGGYARADEATGNGFFTAAVLDAFRGRAGADAEGFVTPNAVAVHVSDDVRKRTRDRQRPEARFGGLEDLQLLRRIEPRRIATLVEPEPNARVAPDGYVGVAVHAPDLYATIFVCPASTGRCWKQNARPVRAPAGAVTRIGVQYGDPDRFRVHVALTADAAFLNGEVEFADVPSDRRASSIVYWLDPVTVTCEEDS
jgi:hypothetical protein